MKIVNLCISGKRENWPKRMVAARPMVLGYGYQYQINYKKTIFIDSFTFIWHTDSYPSLMLILYFLNNARKCSKVNCLHKGRFHSTMNLSELLG